MLTNFLLQIADTEDCNAADSKYRGLQKTKCCETESCCEIDREGYCAGSGEGRVGRRVAERKGRGKTVVVRERMS